MPKAVRDGPHENMQPAEFIRNEQKHAFRNQKGTELLVCPEPFHLKSCEQKGSSTHRGRILTQLKHSNDRHYYHEGCGKVILFLYDFILKPPEYPHSKISCASSYYSMLLVLVKVYWECDRTAGLHENLEVSETTLV